MRKRGRSLSDVSGSIDVLVSCTRVCAVSASPLVSRSGDDGDSQSIGSDAARMQAVSNLSADQMDSQKSAANAFTTEMSFFSRVEEDIADMCVYLARTVSTARTHDAFVSLVEHFVKHGPETVMLSLKRSGLQPRLLDLLCRSSFQWSRGECQRLFLNFFVLVVKLSDTEALCDSALISFLLLNSQPTKKALQPPPSLTSTTLSPAASSPGEESLVVERPLHWSQRVRQAKVVAKASPREPNTTDLKAVVGQLCGTETDVSGASLALRALLDIVFRQNRNTALHADTSVCLMFAELDGFDIVAAFLTGEECSDALHLLEAVTLCEGLRTLHALKLERTAACLVRFLTGKDGKQRMEDEAWHNTMNAALRVLTNVTGLVPSVLCELLQEGRALAELAAEVLTDADAPPDTLAFTLCLVTNIVKWEARERIDAFTSCLVEDPSFLPRVASLTFRAYHAEDTEKNVVAGYYALLLAVLSLCASPALQLRVPVMTAVAHATKGTVAGKMVEAKPMTLIVALLQEFVLFQGSAGSLTKESLVSMSSIIDSVVLHNDIEVVSDG
ncbi:hypothetical protein DQ04_00071270 [Trypanosoma grayi]|uniref:hypothetical protein n=1 Tax=Trypanosoma grayi TaxID=71804 RepID=UPI0004F40E91|nr:hypothetical protein DQ04_00071270 [Trypanosoma grayi]KEG15459.1 hypothetical protein DQ04_00071270 [Trypanosoma grayi]